MTEKIQNLIVRQEDDAIVQPAITADEAFKKFKAFQELKDKLLGENDLIKISGNNYIKKTGWRKIKTVFNLSEEILDSKRDENIDEKWVRWNYKVRVKAKNGTFVDAEMCCDSREIFSRGKPESAIMAMAQTRAFNRAISDLVGGGEVSAEEMLEESNEKAEQAKPIRQADVYLGNNTQKAKHDFVTGNNTGEPEYFCFNPNCRKQVSEKVANYSKENYATILCFNCQQLAKNKIAQTTKGSDGDMARELEGEA